MSDRPRFFEDLAGVAGGAISALSGLREEMEAVMRARIDDWRKREGFDPISEEIRTLEFAEMLGVGSTAVHNAKMIDVD